MTCTMCALVEQEGRPCKLCKAPWTKSRSEAIRRDLEAMYARHGVKDERLGT